jgi:hypothetical protein
MGYSVYYGFEEKEPAEGPHLASGTGWIQWCDFVEADTETYPECAHLAAEGWQEPLDDMRAELVTLKDSGELPENLQEITETLIEAIDKKPKDAPSIIISDGSEPGEDDEEEDE